MGRAGAWAELEAPAEFLGSAAEAGEQERSGGAGGQLLIGRPVGPRWLSKIEPLRFGAALGRRERERERGRESKAGNPIGATSQEGGTECHA